MIKVSKQEYLDHQDKALVPDDYRRALDSQSACNLCGISQAFAKVMVKLLIGEGEGTDWANQHPIARLYAEQIAYLTSGNSIHGSDYSDAHDVCEARSKQ